jgi:hypothetical protein
MDKISEITFESLRNYFSVLSKTGYLSDKKVFQLILLLFIKEFLLEFQGMINEEDYNLLDRIVLCLKGSACLVPFEIYKEQTATVFNKQNARISENDIVRTSAKNKNVRVEE